MKKRRNQLVASLTRWVLPGVVMVGFGIVGVRTLTGSHAATTTPVVFVSPASGTYQPGTKFDVSIDVRWDQKYFESVGAVFHLEGPIKFISGGTVAQSGSIIKGSDYSCQSGFRCDLATGSELGPQYPANEMEISEYIAGEGFPNVPTTTGTFLVVTLHLQATSGNGTGRVVIDPDYTYGYNDVYYPDANSPNPYHYSSIEATPQSGSYTIGTPSTPPSNPNPPSNPSPPSSGGGGSAPVQGGGSGGGSGIQGSGSSVQSPATTAPIQNDTTSGDTQDSGSGFISSGPNYGNGGGSGSGSNNTVIGSTVQKKSSHIGLYVSLVVLLGVAGGAGFWWWRRRSGGGDLAYSELPLPTPVPAPPATPISSVYEEKINEAFYPATHTAQPVAPSVHTHAEEPPDMFELAREHPETYGNDLPAAGTAPPPVAPPMVLPAAEPSAAVTSPTPKIKDVKAESASAAASTPTPVPAPKPKAAPKAAKPKKPAKADDDVGEDGTLVIHHDS